VWIVVVDAGGARVRGRVVEVRAVVDWTARSGAPECASPGDRILPGRLVQDDTIWNVPGIVS
jgi:hypothetical protein